MSKPDKQKVSAKDLAAEARALEVPNWRDLNRAQLEEAVAAAKAAKTAPKAEAKKSGKEKTGSKAKAKSKTASKPKAAKPAPTPEPAAEKKVAKPAAKKAAAKKAAPKSTAKAKPAPKKSAAKKTAAPKKSASKKPKADPSKNAKAPKVAPGDNPFRKGTNIHVIHDLLVKGGKRRTLAAQLQKKIGDLHPYSKGKPVDLADYDKRIVLGAQESAKRGFRETRTGRGLDGTIKIEFVGRRSTKRVKK